MLQPVSWTISNGNSNDFSMVYFIMILFLRSVISRHQFGEPNWRWYYYCKWKGIYQTHTIRCFTAIWWPESVCHWSIPRPRIEYVEHFVSIVSQMNFPFDYTFIIILDRITMEFVNQYWPFFAREILPQARETIEPVLIEEANKFLLHVPIRKMLYYGEETD